MIQFLALLSSLWVALGKLLHLSGGDSITPFCFIKGKKQCLVAAASCCVCACVCAFTLTHRTWFNGAMTLAVAFKCHTCTCYAWPLALKEGGVFIFLYTELGAPLGASLELRSTCLSRKGACPHFSAGTPCPF